MYQFRADGSEYTYANTYHDAAEYRGDEDAHSDS